MDKGKDSLFLVSCVARKRSTASRAKDLYTSPLFTKMRRYVEAQDARWLILSAQYGLLAPDAWADPYDRTLHSMTAAERRSWASQILEQLRPQAACADRLVVLAGKKYREFLMPVLVELVPKVEVPLKGLRIGEQMAWLDRHSPHP
jgi:hypothetical protein